MARRGILPTLTRKANLLSPSMQKWPAHQNLSSAVGGLLSPTFAEWLMGFPTNWTFVETKPSGTQ